MFRRSFRRVTGRNRLVIGGRDIGRRVIGRRGRVAKAIRTVAQAAADEEGLFGEAVVSLTVTPVSSTSPVFVTR